MKSSKNHYSVFTTIAAFLFVFILSANAFAASDIFLKLEGVDGEVYKAPVDPATGTCDFKNVKPGKYKVTLIVSNSVLASHGVSSSDNSMPQSIEISSFSWGVSNSSQTKGTGMGAGKVSVSSFNVRSGGDEQPTESLSTTRSASPAATAPVTGGFTKKKCELTCRKAGGKQEDYYTVRMDDIQVPAVVTDGATASKTGKTGYDVKACVKI